MMQKIVFLLSLIVILAAPAAAQERCEEGRTRDGKCVNAEAAEMGRKDALLSTQMKLSMTAPPIMPGDPDEGRYSYNHAEIKAFFIDRLSRHGLTPFNSTSPVPCTPTPRAACP